MTSNPVFPYRTNYNFVLEEVDKEHNHAPSLTVPDMSYTMKEIIEKFTQGVLPDLSKVGGYPEEDPTFDDTDPVRDPAWDLADATTALKDISQKLEILNKNEPVNGTAPIEPTQP